MNDALKHVQAALKLLTNLSLQSIATLLPEGSTQLAEYNEDLNKLSAMINLDEGKLNRRWNKTYGAGGTQWQGILSDGRTRGDISYFCPEGWARFSLNVCSDEDFESQFAGWGYLYHGTNSKFVGSILTSGLRASRGLCYCGQDDHAVYMSPSIEYCGHPRYGCVEYNPETRKWMQLVLQCRVKPSAVWRKGRETLGCGRFDLKCDSNISNDEIEWLFRPTDFDPISKGYFIKDAIICTGVMMRITDIHPFELNYWWTRHVDFMRKWNCICPVVKPNQRRDETWTSMTYGELDEFTMLGSCLDGTFKIQTKTRKLGPSWLSQMPFGKGGMRFAFYLETAEGLFALNMYNEDTLKHIRQVLRISEHEAMMKEVATYLAAGFFAEKFNNSLPKEYDVEGNKIHFLAPYVFRLTDTNGNLHTMFGERYVDGTFLKWNSNAGYVNTHDEAKHNKMDKMAEVFCHYTWHASRGRLMVVDIQGWSTRDAKQVRQIVFTDPQVHTTVPSDCADRKNDVLFKRFSLGNLGKVGMARFFQSHVCTCNCRAMGLKANRVERRDSDSSAKRRKATMFDLVKPMQAPMQEILPLPRRLMPIHRGHGHCC
jgi:alpha-kinase